MLLANRSRPNIFRFCVENFLDLFFIKLAFFGNSRDCPALVGQSAYARVAAIRHGNGWQCQSQDRNSDDRHLQRMRHFHLRPLRRNI